MSNIPKKVSDRLAQEIKKYQKILETSKDKDVNEADTVTIITDMLSDIFGYDKYSEITREQAIRGTFCDLAVQLDGKTQFLIEAKAIGLELNENHLRQAINYGANEGIHWIILTNGVIWQIYKIKDQLPVDFDLVCKINVLEVNPRKAEDQDQLFLICKEGAKKSAIEEFHTHKQSVNKFMVGALLTSDPVIQVVRRELRKIADGVKVSAEEIEEIIRTETLKREILDGDAANEASKKIRKLQRKEQKKAA